MSLISKCHGYPVYQAAISGCTSDIEFGTKEEAEQLINGHFCYKCNKACEVVEADPELYEDTCPICKETFQYPRGFKSKTCGNFNCLYKLAVKKLKIQETVNGEKR